jgi:glycosyltransferase involved in cell wall biosynthesis
MKEADVLALPSLVETFGIVAVEALAAGLPVVCTSACGVAELVAAHDGVVVPPADVSALTTALETLLDRSRGVPPSTIEALRRTFGPEAIGERWAAIYGSLVART